MTVNQSTILKVFHNDNIFKARCIVIHLFKFEPLEVLLKKKVLSMKMAERKQTFQMTVIRIFLEEKSKIGFNGGSFE